VRKLFISLSLPKTGTTYLGALLSQMRSCELPIIKEPNFFFTNEESNCSLMQSILSQGNYSRGRDWYDNLFPSNQNICGLDMSTQYWLHVDEMFQRTSKRNVTFLTIKRDPLAQLVSYISHLRRGHIQDVSLRHLVESHAEFEDYLNEMKHWNDKYDRIRAHHLDLEFIEVSFEELVTNPHSTIVSILGKDDKQGKINTKVEKNKKSYPVFPALNKLLFSQFIRKFGRMMPGKIYSSAVAFRKAVVKSNLKIGQGRFHEEDSQFIRECFFNED